MIKTLRNFGLFQKKENAGKAINSSGDVSENPGAKKKVLNPHADDMCCGNCGGNKTERK